MKVIYKNLGTRKKAYFRQNPDGFVTIVINTQISWCEQRRAYLHELEHIKENDLFSHMSASEIEKIRHSFPSELQKQFEDEQSCGVIGFYSKSQEEIEYEKEQEWGNFFKSIGKDYTEIKEKGLLRRIG